MPGRVAATGVEIAGCGMALPTRVVSNAELGNLVGVDPEVIERRTGIRERRWVSDGEGTAVLATRAAEAALGASGIPACDLGLVVVATATPEYAGFPATASLVQHAIGATLAGAFDLGAGCSAFLYALALVANQVTCSGRPALVIGSEAFSRVLDMGDPIGATLFGDGAGALVLQPTARASGPLGTVLRSDGAGAAVAHITHAQHLLRMDGRSAGQAMLERLPPTIHQALGAANLGVDDVDLFVPQDTNARLTRQLMQVVGFSDSRLASELTCLGNTATATLPIALAAAAARGRLPAGSHVVLAAFGAGYAWASLVWRW